MALEPAVPRAAKRAYANADAPSQEPNVRRGGAPRRRDEELRVTRLEDCNALDNLRHSPRTVAPRHGHLHHNGRFRPHSAGGGGNHSDHQPRPRTTPPLGRFVGTTAWGGGRRNSSEGQPPRGPEPRSALVGSPSLSASLSPWSLNARSLGPPERTHDNEDAPYQDSRSRHRCRCRA